MIKTYELQLRANYLANGVGIDIHHENMSATAVKRYVEYYRENYDLVSYVILSEGKVKCGMSTLK